MGVSDERERLCGTRWRKALSFPELLLTIVGLVQKLSEIVKTLAGGKFTAHEAKSPTFKKIHRDMRAFQRDQILLSRFSEWRYDSFITLANT